MFDAEGNCIATVQLNSDQVMRDTYFFTVNRWGYILVSSRLEGCIKTFSPEGEFIRETGRGQANDCYALPAQAIRCSLVGVAPKQASPSLYNGFISGYDRSCDKHFSHQI